MANEPDALIRSFVGQPILNDPRVGQVQGEWGLRDFVYEIVDWLRKRDVAVVKNVALTRTRTLLLVPGSEIGPLRPVSLALQASVRNRSGFSDSFSRQLSE